MIIRLANKFDAEVINEIYNESVKHKFLTADTQTVALTERIKWLLSYNKHEYPVYVATEHDAVVGWLAVRPYREGRNALRFIKEVSYYVSHDHLHKGIGTALIEHVIMKAPDLKIKNLVAIVLEENIASIKLLEKFNFQQWGFLPGVADFDGEICGHLYYGLKIS